ncbi:MAG: RNA polymerase sigma factor [Planctomycetota bacterium]
MTEPILQNQNDDAAMLERRFRRGDDEAFDEVIESFLPSIRSLVYRLLGWDSDVDDVAQDVFVTAFSKRRTFRADASLKTWLYAIAVNQCQTRNRRRRLWQMFMKQSGRHETRRVVGPVAASLQQERAEQIQQAVRQLPEKYRDVIVLKYLEELETEEILRILKINDKTFYTRLTRGRGHLKRLLSGFMEESADG